MFPGYLAVFDIHFSRINRILNKIKVIFDQFPQILLNIKYLFCEFDEEGEVNDPDIDLTPYEAIDLSFYDSKYCVYWYKYDKSYVASDQYSFLGDYWRPLEKIQ
jgi:hypothetical protein